MTTSNYRLAVIDDTPIAYFPLDEASDPVDLKLGNPLTAFNTPTAATDYNTGWTFDAASSEYLYIDCDSLDDVAGWIHGNAGQFSLEAWIKKPSPTSSGASRPIRWGWYGFFMQVYEFNGQADGYITCGFTDSGGTERSVEHYGSYFDNTWKHVVVTHDGANLKLYVNGSLVATQARAYEAYISQTTGQDGIGIGRDGPFSQSYYTGSVDDVAVYNYPLTSTQISTHYAATRTSQVGSEPAIQDPGTPGPRQPPEGIASSFHAFWDSIGSNGPYKEVSVDLEVVTEPTVTDLYFWALQVSFYDDIATPSSIGGGHTGLQWNSAHPNSNAVNWGGYDADSVELSGSVSSLPSTPNNDNTRDYDWSTGVTYSFRIWIPEEGTIRASVNGTTIRDLYCPGTLSLNNIVMWSEVFAECSAASAGVKWSNFTAIDMDDVVWEETDFYLTYQAPGNDGCLNTNTYGAGMTVRQVTNTTRVNQDQDVITLSPIVSGGGDGTGFIPIA